MLILYCLLFLGGPPQEVMTPSELVEAMPLAFFLNTVCACAGAYLKGRQDERKRRCK